MRELKLYVLLYNQLVYKVIIKEDNETKVRSVLVCRVN